MMREGLIRRTARCLVPLLLVCFINMPVGACQIAETLPQQIPALVQSPGAATGQTTDFVQSPEEVLAVQPASAKWESVGNSLRLRSSNGKYKTGMVRYKGKYYYFDKKGYLKCGFITWKGKKYYASYVRGEMGKGEILTGLVKAGAYYYFLNPSSSKVPGAVSTGFVNISGRPYYFDQKGHMVTGWFSVGGYTYYGGCSKKSHYGALLTGLHTIGNKKYHFDLQGRLVKSVSSGGTDFSTKFRVLCQYPELPTGCEITSLTMVLNYYGYPADKLTMADKYLEKGRVGKVSFWEKFLGNPRDRYSYGCYAPVIVKAANRYLTERNSALRARYYSGKTLESLASYTSVGIPVIIWSTVDCRPGRYTSSWVIDGRRLTWYAPEHCMVLVGFRGTSVLIADPIYGKIVAYDKEKFRKGYQGLYSQTVVIH